MVTEERGLSDIHFPTIADRKAKVLVGGVPSGVVHGPFYVVCDSLQTLPTALRCAARSLFLSEYHHSELFEKVIQGLVRHHARKLIRCGVFKPQDKDDLKQALFVRLWISLRAYRSSRGSHGPFLKVVSKHAAVNLLRDQLAQKRNSAGITSLNVNILCGGRWGEFAQVISQRELEARTGRTARSDRERCELKHDVNEVIGQLHPHLQQLAERLKHSTISEVARDLGLPRASVYESVGQIRRRFEKAGLKKYLTPFSVSRSANGVINR